MIAIRPEKPADCDAIRQIVIDAFSNSPLGHNGEADIVDRLRDNCPESVSLVAVENDQIVGHVFFSPVAISTLDGVLEGMGLAPMAVKTECQGRGIGTELIQAALQQLDRTGCPCVVVLGHPEYYSRFGFVPAANFQIAHGFQGAPQELFLIKAMDAGALKSFSKAIALFRPEFGPQVSDPESDNQ